MKRTLFWMALPALLLAQAPAPAPSYKDLKFPPLKKLEIPDIEQVTLPNGMRLYLLEDRELPLVRGLALVRTGNLFDPKDKIGLATITSPETVQKRNGTATSQPSQTCQRRSRVRIAPN